MTMIARISSKFAELETNPRYQYSFLAAITLLATVLRFYKLGEWSFWVDEINTLGRAQAHYSSFEAIMRNIPPSINWIPLSVILTGGVSNVLGTSEWSARLVPALIGLLTIPILYFPVRKMFGARVALLAGLLLAVAPFHLYASQSARYYTSLVLFYSLALFAFYFGLERDRPRYILLSIVLLYLAASERLLALFIVPVMICYLLLLTIMPFEKPPGLRVKNPVLLGLPAIAFGIRELYSLVNSGHFFLSDTIGFFGRASQTPPRLLAAFVYYLGLPLFCLGLFGSGSLLLEKKRAGLLVVLGAWVPLLLLLGLSLYAGTNVRYLFIALPYWVILGAVAAKEAFSQIQKPGRVLAFVLLLLLVADPLHRGFLYYTYENGYRPDWSSAYEIVNQRIGENDLIFTNKQEIGRYYTSASEVRSTRGVAPYTIEEYGSRVWFVIGDVRPTVEPDLHLWIRRNCDLIDVLPASMPGKSLTIWIYLYDPAPPSDI